MATIIEQAEVRNVKIESTHLGIEDHGIFTFSLTTLGGAAGQGAGFYTLGLPFSDKNQHWSSCEILWRIMQVVGVESWEELAGKYIRVKATHTKVLAIGNITEDRWLDFEEFFNKGT